MSNRYISKPEIIEAIQYDGTNADKLKKLDTDRQAILIDGKGLYLRHFDEFDFLICEEGIGKGDWLVRYEDGETLELFTDDEFKECFLKMSEKHLDHATGWLSDFIKQREIDIDETVSTHLTSKIKHLENTNYGEIIMCPMSIKPIDMSWEDFINKFKDLNDDQLPQGVKRLDFNNDKDIAYYKQQLNNIGGRCSEPNSTFEDNVQKLKEEREVNKRVQNYFKDREVNSNPISKKEYDEITEKLKYETSSFTKFLQSLKQLIKEAEDDTSK